jgi:MazG family protein
MARAGELLDKLQEIVHRLRDPKTGCPWDKEQTHETLKPFLIEEAYEVIDAIDQKKDKLGEELGDVLLQIMLHSEIASETGRFDISKVIEHISQKMITRHPHVFGDVKADTSKQVLQNWETIKQKELKDGTSILDGVPRGMPALIRAQRTGEKAARVGFEWPTLEGVRDKVFEELREFLEVCCDPKQDRERLKDEFGDILFALTQLSRRLEFNSEELLHKAADKFVRRFKEIERRAGPDMKALGLEKLDALWNEVKKEEKAGAP